MCLSHICDCRKRTARQLQLISPAADWHLDRFTPQQETNLPISPCPGWVLSIFSRVRPWGFSASPSLAPQSSSSSTDPTCSQTCLVFQEFKAYFFPFLLKIPTVNQRTWLKLKPCWLGCPLVSGCNVSARFGKFSSQLPVTIMRDAHVFPPFFS